MNTPKRIALLMAALTTLPAFAADQPAASTAPASAAASAPSATTAAATTSAAPAMTTPASTGTTAATTAAPAASAAAPGTRGNARGGPNTAMGLPPTITPGTKVELIQKLPTESYTVDGAPFTEGTTCAPNGDVYFVEQNSDKIMHYSVADKKLSVFMHPSGYSNGMCFDYQGNLISCADERDELWSISLTETETVPYPQPLNPAVGDKPTSGNITRPKHTVLVKDYQGKLLGGPNDVWVRPDGGMYLTDPYYFRKWWAPDRKQQQLDAAGKPFRTVYFLSPDHKTLTRVIDVFNSGTGTTNGTPNGIAGTPDGKTLYVSDISGGQTWSFDIQKDGSLTNKKLTCSFGSDGMTLDDHGNLYMSVGTPRGQPSGVTVVDTKTGKQIGFITMPEGPANMCFGGKDRQTLYICARTGFYSIPTNVKGANPGK